MNVSDIQEYGYQVASAATMSPVRAHCMKAVPFLYIMGEHEATVEYARSRGIHPSLFKPVVCWPNLVDGAFGRNKLILVRGFSQVEQYERIIRRAKLFGYEVKHA